MNTHTISVLDSKTLLTMFGPRDTHLRKIRQELGVTITAREDRILIEGEERPVAQATQVLEQLKRIAEQRGGIDAHEVSAAISSVTGKVAGSDHAPIPGLAAGRQVRPRTPGQAVYIDAIKAHDLTFCVGPAGCGKTYLAVAMAVSALKQDRIRKIVLVRPAVEAGESLGYLPGNLQEKINPYLRPLLDALQDLLDYEQVQRFCEQGVIEMAPLAYMRGRTLNEAFIILDEAQNTTIQQMKMFLTRMGNNSKIIVCGDTTQIDLPPNNPSGLIDALARLRGIKSVAEIYLEKSDIVRHRLVQEIVDAYADDDTQGHVPLRKRR
jgi:phosphate starvation-inducible protein PhoH and related proteins